MFLFHGYKELGQQDRIHQECWYNIPGPLQVCAGREVRSQLVQSQQENGADLEKVAGGACQLIPVPTEEARHFKNVLPAGTSGIVEWLLMSVRSEEVIM